MGPTGLRVLTHLAITIALLGLPDPPPIAAQATTVALQGTITGSDGSIPGGGHIDVRSRETSAARGVLADHDGRYRVLGLTPGIYDVTVRAIGYRQRRHEGVRLVVGQRAVLDFTLERGAVELEPVVTNADRALEVLRTDVSTPVLQEEIEKLPLNSRNVLNVAAIAPGIRTYAVEGGRSMPAAGAMPVTEQRFVNLYVDGVELKGMYTGQVVGTGTTSMLPQEAVREFRVYLNPYDVEHTRGASYIMSAVTHRGGNKLEGSLFGFLQNKVLVAKGSFQSQEPAYNRSQAGGNLRGPIVKDRLFFSLSYERQFTDNYIDVVPGQPAEDPDKWDAYAGTFKAPQRHHTGLLRLTAPVRSHTLDAIWSARHIWSESGFGVRLNGFMLAHEGGLTGINRVNSVQLRDTYATASMVNELSLHFLDSRFTNDLLFPGPTFQYPGIQLRRQNFPLILNDRHLRAINKTSYTIYGTSGQHVIKSGVEVTRARTSVYRPSNADGFFLFARDTSTLPFEGRIAVGLADRRRQGRQRRRFTAGTSGPTSRTSGSPCARSRSARGCGTTPRSTR